MKNQLVLFALLFTVTMYANTNLPKDGSPVVTSFQEGDNRFNSIKLEALSNNTLENLGETFFDISKLKNMFPGVDDITTISENSEEKTFYLSFDLPFPLKDRSVTILMKKEKISTNKTVIKIEKIKSQVPEGCKKVQFSALDCEIILEATGNQTKVSQSLYFDPGGKMPKKMFNNKLEKKIPELFKSLI